VIAILQVSLFLPHYEVTAVGFLSNALQFILLILSLYLVKYESVKKTKLIFVNFAALFGMAFLFYLYNFVGTMLFTQEPMARHYYFQYVSHALYFFLLAFSICYVTLDVLFRDFRVLQKYLLTFAIVGGFFAYYYHPYFSDPRYLYTTDEIAEWKELDKANSTLQSQSGIAPTFADLSAYLSHVDGSVLARLDEGARHQRVEALYRYLDGSNYKNLLFKPLYLNSIYMCVLAVGLILLFFGYQYKKDPPQGAYIEKMMFFFLMFCTLEVFHAWSFIKTIEWDASLQIIEIGQFLSAFVLAIIALFFALRLRFITSVYGEFYEHEIVERPSSITRWRDSLDNLVIAHFFKRNELVGRMLVDPKAKSK
jgi:hypothetical protein